MIEKTSNWTLCRLDGWCWIDWLDHWQTMLSGLAAVAAAVVSIVYLKSQISLAAHQDARQRRARLASARLRLSVVLADITLFSNEGITLLKEYLDAALRNPKLMETLTMRPRPAFPDQAIILFESLIEATDDQNFAALIAQLATEMQVLNSRMRNLARDWRGMDSVNVEAYLMCAAKVGGIASSLYGYARREVDEPPHALDWDGAISALTQNDMRKSEYPSLHAFIARAKQRAEDLPAAG